MDKERQKVLEWYVQFCQINLGELSSGDKAKLTVEVDERLLELHEFSDIKGPFQDFHLPSKQTTKYWAKIGEFQNQVKEILYELAPHRLGEYKEIALRLRSIEASYFLKKAKTFTLVFVIHSPQLNECIRLMLYKFLDGLPTTTFQRCWDCEKIFLNPSRREKRFCFPRCMWKFNARKRREKDPEGYKKYQRKLMAKRYREKLGLKPLKEKGEERREGQK